jgi:hypothetical protein
MRLCASAYVIAARLRMTLLVKLLDTTCGSKQGTVESAALGAAVQQVGTIEQAGGQVQ